MSNNIAAHPEKELTAKCGPRELVQRLLRMSYGLCLQEADGPDKQKAVDSASLVEIGEAFLDDVDAIERCGVTTYTSCFWVDVNPKSIQKALFRFCGLFIWSSLYPW